MSLPTERAASVYDLGYRNYKGARLGRTQAVLSLYFSSLRGIFGLGRHTSSKILPWALAIIALIPAVWYLAIVALAEVIDFDLLSPVDYFGALHLILALFVATVAPELVGRDQRNHTLPLYFSRALKRGDYVFAKMAALSTALLSMALVPQAVVFIGSSMAGSDSLEYFRENWQDIGPIVASGAMLSVMWSSVALAVGSQTDRWPLASGGIIAYFVISAAVAALLVHSNPDSATRFAALLSGFDVINGFTHWVFDATPPEGETLDVANISLSLYAVAAVVTTAVALFFVHLRYRRMTL